MKIIVRTVIILVAALVVVGIASALNSAGAFANLELVGRGGFEGGRSFGQDFNGQPQTLPNGTRPNFERGGFGRGGGGREGRGGASIFGLSEVSRSIIMMTVVIVVIVLASKFLKRLRPNRSASESN